MWNRLRYTVWAPFYDAMVNLAGFADARRESLTRLHLRSGDRLLIVGAGTGLDLEYVPSGVEITAIDVTPAMLDRLRQRAARNRQRISVRLMDARRLDFADAAFDAIVMHLILAVMPEPERGIREAARVLKPGGRIVVFDKFLGNEERPSIRRRLLNAVTKILFSDINLRFGPLLAGTALQVERDQPSAFGGMYRVITLLK